MTQPFQQPVDPFQNAQRQMQQEQMARMQVSQDRLKEQVIAVFGNPHGMQLLETLEEMYVKQPVCPAGCIEGYGYMREGQNSLINKFRKIMNQAQTPQSS